VNSKPYVKKEGRKSRDTVPLNSIDHILSRSRRLSIV
jgi:hypothetical protein